MRMLHWQGISAAALVLALLPGFAPEAAADMMAKSEQTLSGFAFPESVGCDSAHGAIYVSQFGSALKPTEKDGMGRIAKLAPDGTVLEAQFLPAQGQTLHKPKGIWIQDGSLWVTDIDAVWQFDLASKRGRKIELPGIQFANDPAVQDGVLYVTDNRGDQLYRVMPANFLNEGGEPKVSVVFSGKGVNPNGIFPAKDGRLLLVGFKSGEEARGVYALKPGGEPEQLSEAVGRLDGVHENADGSLLVTDWNSGSLFSWSKAAGAKTLAQGFKGPADFCVLSGSDGMTVYVPDLVQSQLRIIKLGQ